MMTPVEKQTALENMGNPFLDFESFCAKFEGVNSDPPSRSKVSDNTLEDTSDKGDYPK